MYVLEFLSGLMKGQAPQEPILCEYRLVCSGIVYNSDVKTTDWTKSSYAKVILNKPVNLIVANEHITDYPQELSLRFVTSLVKEQSGENMQISFYPDEDVARDLAAILSLLFRRLVIVGGKIRQVFLSPDESMPDFLHDRPIGIISSLNKTHWERHPSIIEYGPRGTERLIDYNPSPKAIQSTMAAKILSALPKMPHAVSIVQSARLYALALERMHKEVDMSYQLLVACIENIANDSMKSFRPDEAEIIATKQSVFNLALQFGLSKEQSIQIAVEATKGMNWNTKKFLNFLQDNISDELWIEEDDTFRVPERFIPPKDDFEDAIKKIYQTRGKVAHSGGEYPPSASVGLGPTLPSRQLFNAYGLKSAFPPLPWFERVVNIALRRFIERNIEAILRDTDSLGANNT
ncbi:MAG: hypothetical protein U0Z53_01420 [Blastocatellia bacterium]